MRGLQRLSLEAVSTISVDIFDTLLIRKIRPESRQFWIVAGRWMEDFYDIYGVKIEQYYLFSLREDVRRMLRTKKALEKTYSTEAKFDGQIIGVEEWFGEIISYAEHLRLIKVDESSRIKLLNKMIDSEIEIEKKFLRINRKLVSWILEEKKLNERLRVYYLSDMYLRAKDIENLLQHFGIAEVFAGGTTSSDQKMGKWSGKLYKHYMNGILSRTTNLHIGDNLHSDIIMARKAGSAAIHLLPMHRRIISACSNRYGNLKLYQIRKINRYKASKIYRNEITNNTNYSTLVTNIAPSLCAYIIELSWLSKSTEGNLFISVSSESSTFDRVLDSTSISRDIYGVPHLNRAAMLAALAGAYLDKGRPVYETLRGEYGIRTLPDCFQYLFGSKAPSDLTISKLDKYFVDYLGVFVDESKRLVNHIFDLAQDRNIVILDLGWNASVQAHLQEYANITRRYNVINGVYMGIRANSRRLKKINGIARGWLWHDIGEFPDSQIFVPDIWEYFLTGKHYGLNTPNDSPIKLAEIAEDMIRRHISTPMELYFSNYKSLRKMFINPSAKEVEFLGRLVIDSSTDQKNGRTLVQKTTPSSVIFALTKVDSQKYTYLWTEGTLKSVHLLWTLRAIRWLRALISLVNFSR